jgi:hypothetical protein
MLLNMWSTGELRREYKSHDSKIYMKITRPLETGSTPVVVLLNNASFYYPDSPGELFANMPVYVEQACGRLGLPEEMTSIRRYLDYIQDGFDELFKQTPEDTDRDRQVYGEMTTKFGDMVLTKEVSR